MKRKSAAAFFILILSIHPVSGWSQTEGKTSMAPAMRPLVVMMRGAANVLGAPAEIYSTGVREVRMHKWVWPVSYVPRLVTNLFIRAASGVNDFFLAPWVVPYTDDISPITEPMALPAYPWQIE